MLSVQTQRSGNVAKLCVQGRLVSGETDVLSDAVRSQLNSSVIVLDFAGVEMIDARGLGVLLELREFCQLKGIEFRLLNVNSLVEEVLEITRLNSVFDVSSQRSRQPLPRVRRSTAINRPMMFGKATK